MLSFCFPSTVLKAQGKEERLKPRKGEKISTGVMWVGSSSSDFDFNGSFSILRVCRMFVSFFLQGKFLSILEQEVNIKSLFSKWIPKCCYKVWPL